MIKYFGRSALLQKAMPDVMLTEIHPGYPELPGREAGLR